MPPPLKQGYGPKRNLRRSVGRRLLLVFRLGDAMGNGPSWLGRRPPQGNTGPDPGAVVPLDPLAQYLPLNHRANAAQARYSCAAKGG